jgi:hypothetical protein
MKVPVKIAFTMKKGMRMIGKERKKLFKVVILNKSTADNNNITTSEYTRV